MTNKITPKTITSKALTLSNDKPVHSERSFGDAVKKAAKTPIKKSKPKKK